MWSEQLTNSVGQQQLLAKQTWSAKNNFDPTTEAQKMKLWHLWVDFSAVSPQLGWRGKHDLAEFGHQVLSMARHFWQSAFRDAWLNSAPTIKILFIEIFPWRVCDSPSHTRGLLSRMTSDSLYLPVLRNRPPVWHSQYCKSAGSGKNPSGFSNQFKLR